MPTWQLCMTMTQISQVYFSAVLLLVLSSVIPLGAQDLADFRWKNRIVLIISAQPDLKEAERQMAEFRKVPDQLAERKVKVFLVCPSKYTQPVGYEQDSIIAWGSAQWYDRMVTRDEDFEVLLIGLDGGVKWRQSELMSNEFLFQKIDSMPMRRTEIQRKGS